MDKTEFTYKMDKNSSNLNEDISSDTLETPKLKVDTPHLKNAKVVFIFNPKQEIFSKGD